ncbi:hypothetical protein I3760_01G170800 [Carya illinoinensis]|nr:hypothetical protein I3760_01G170800 [Carya illinoinensis]
MDELEFLNSSCRDAGVVHSVGNAVVRAKWDSKFYKKIVIYIQYTS